MKKGSILIVEDERILAENLQLCLKRLGYCVPAIVSTGEDAVRVAQRTKPDLVLMDIMLEGDMDGVEAAHLMNSFLDIPVVYLTSRTDAETLDRAKVTDSYGYMVKPITENDLRCTVDMALYKARMEKRLRESEERYRAVVETQTELICRFLLDGTLTFVNEAYCRYFGRPREQLIGRSFLPLLYAGDHNGVKECLASCSREKPVLIHEYRVIRPDGEVRWSQWTNRVIFDDDSDVFVEFQGVGRDITDLKHAEDALRESEERFRSIFEHSLDGIILGYPDGKVFNANPAASRMFGMTEQEMCRAGRDGLIDREDVRWNEFLEERERVGGSVGVLNLRRKDGSRFPADISSTIFNTAKGEQRTSLIIRDVTERKLAELALKEKTAALERSNKDLEHFASAAAHDLREPLVAVGAYLKLLERRAGNILDEEAKKFLSRALEAVLRMDWLIQGLLAYSLVSENQKQSEATDCGACLSLALANLKTAIEESGAVLTVEPMPTVLGIPVHITQLFQNVIGNAIKFRGNRPLQIHVGVERAASEYQFFVRDNGMGIEPSHFERIFQIFQRIEKPPGPSGAGIGLATCRKIVESHGGRIWVESQPGKGATFRFTLPAAEHES